MSSYASREDLRGRLGETEFRELYGTNLSAADDDLASAAAEIDGAIGSRYSVPVTAEEPRRLLKDWNLTLAEERAGSRAAGGNLREKIKERVEQVRKYLAMILAEEFQLPGAEANETDGVAAHVVTSSDEPNFTRESLQGY